MLNDSMRLRKISNQKYNVIYSQGINEVEIKLILTIKIDGIF